MFNLKDCFRIFEDKWDTLWWLGENYHNKYGNVWPHQGKDPPKGYVYPSGTGLQLVLICALFLTIFRFIFERVIAAPLGRYLGLKDTQRGTAPEPIEILEKLVKKARHKMPGDEDLQIAAESLSMEKRDVERWIRKKLRYVVPSKLTKFTESCWAFCFHTYAFSYGIYILTKEDFFWDTRLCWVGYPEHTWAIKESIFAYYVIQGAHYCSLMVSHFFDIKRKDFWEMFMHHIATITLIVFSYFIGSYRIGSLVLVTHDIADIFLEAAKCSVYTKWTLGSTVFFVGFALTFFFSRLVFFPYKILYSATVECYYMVPNMPVHTFLCIFIIGLQVLHIYWFSFIIKLVVKTLAGDEVHDTRSEEETPPSSSPEEEKKVK